jgi:hypothetical protein
LIGLSIAVLLIVSAGILRFHLKHYSVGEFISRHIAVAEKATGIEGEPADTSLTAAQITEAERTKLATRPSIGSELNPLDGMAEALASGPQFSDVARSEAAAENIGASESPSASPETDVPQSLPIGRSTLSASQPESTAVSSTPPAIHEPQWQADSGEGSPATPSSPGLEAPGTNVENLLARAHEQPADRAETRERLLPVIDGQALVSRGDMLFGIGDIASARLFYERAVETGNTQAAIRLGETFDPLFLSRSGLRGVSGDPRQALKWYTRARELGSREADILISGVEGR